VTAHRALLVAACLLLAQACASPGLPFGRTDAASVPGYRVVRDVRLPGDTSRWDYQAYDAVAHRLYIAHLGAGEVVIFDTRRQAVVATVPDVAGVHGLAVAPDLHRLYASATGRNELAIIDTERFQRLTSVPAGQYPDGLAYVPRVGEVFVSDEGGTGDTVVEATSGRAVGTVELGGDIGNTQYDPATDRVYVAVGSDNVLAAVDPERLRVVSRYSLGGCSGAHGVQVDVAGRHRVFVSCEGNATLVAVDLVTGPPGRPSRWGMVPTCSPWIPGAAACTWRRRAARSPCSTSREPRRRSWRAAARARTPTRSPWIRRRTSPICH
jgi:DNA-binding beta-propeller fold protein YncE